MSSRSDTLTPPRPASGELRPDATATLRAALATRMHFLDGAMGTVIQRFSLDEADYRGVRFADWPSDVKGNNDLLTLTQPQIIEGIHDRYLAAGADIIETNTFNSIAPSQGDYRMESLVRECPAQYLWSYERYKAPAGLSHAARLEAERSQSQGA